MHAQHPTPSHSPGWRPVGAWTGGTVSTVAYSPHISQDGLVLAATAAGLFRSTDRGRSWGERGQGIPDPHVVSLAFAPHAVKGALLAFAATEQGRLYHSRDGGRSWAELTGWAGYGIGLAIAPSPAFNQDQTLFVATGDGMYRSQDGGQSWESSTFGLYDPDVLCIACDPAFAASELLWVGSAGGGIFRSRNGGRAWRESGSGLPDSAIQCIAVSPGFDRDQTLLAGTETAGLFRSRDGGASWQPVGPELADQGINCLATLALPGSQGFPLLLAGTTAGLYRSQDGGDHWSLADGPVETALSVALAPDGSAVAGTFLGGIALSADGGRSWQLSNQGLTAHAPPLVTLAGSDGLVAVDIDGALAWSRDGGRSWQTHVGGFDASPTRALQAATRGAKVELFATSAEGLYRWQGPALPADSGWIEQALPLPAPQPVAVLALAPAFPADATVVVADTSGTLHLSIDGGEAWRTLPCPWPGSVVYNLCFAPDFAANGSLYAVAGAVDPQGHYAMQLWHTTDRGEGWQNLATFVTEIPFVALTATVDGRTDPLYLATRNRVIKLSTDPQSRQLRGDQIFLPDGVQVTGLLASPGFAADGTLLAATSRGVWRTTDAGATWAVWGDELAAETVVSLQRSSSQQLYAITLGGTVWWQESEVAEPTSA